MADTVLVRPRGGLILDGIPRSGAEIPKALADEWLADRLVERITPVVAAPPVHRKQRRSK